jgi:lipopolysaccharide biosynthesis glycosyltransferase
MNAEMIKAHKGPHALVHRLKIKIIQDCITRFEGKILYTDSDIYFIKSIETLFDQIDALNFLMCNNEGTTNLPGNRVFEKFSKFIREHTSYLNDNAIPIPADITIRNAGIIGFVSPNKELIDKVLYTNDIIFEKFRSHVVEQLPFCYQLQMHGNVHKSTNYVFHYWNLKEFRIILAEFFKYHLPFNSLDKMIQDVDSIRPDVLILPKLEYESLSFIKKNLRKLMGRKRRWKFPAYSIGVENKPITRT